MIKRKLNKTISLISSKIRGKVNSGINKILFHDQNKTSKHHSITVMKAALYKKSLETEEHTIRLIKLTKAVGLAMGLSDQLLDELELFATVHDIGKIGIDILILNKPGELTDSEWIEMKKHSEIGYSIAMTNPKLLSVANYILTHHERWDGMGYPQGLEGENIPLLSRILAVADAYDTMLEDRPFQKGMLRLNVLIEIIKNAGTQFDPEIAKLFLRIITEEDRERYKEVNENKFINIS